MIVHAKNARRTAKRAEYLPVIFCLFVLFNEMALYIHGVKLADTTRY